ncbi:MAG TPA: CoA pyrophosphatase [Gemmatimonadaceae bacterium]|nr:CoA pyrophosphatase [Gemmatimonadaceae bacterium]
MSDIETLLAHPDIARIARLLADRPGVTVDPGPPVRRAAVALVLRAVPAGELEMLMIKRSEHEGDPWSGHVALPGGRQEPLDRDLLDTALRETREETGLDLAAIGRVLGTLDDLHPRTPSLPPIMVRPYVAVVAADVALGASPEVADAFWVPLAELRQGTRWIDVTVPIRGERHTVTAFQHGPYVVWGMTERLIRQFIALLT